MHRPADATTPWVGQDEFGRLTSSPLARSWLTEAGSLTARLRQHHPQLAVDVVGEHLEPPLAEEALRLALDSGDIAWVREVTLHENGLALLQARTVIPNWSPANPWCEVQRLGRRPLGEILFSDPELERSRFEFTCGPGWRESCMVPVPDRLARRCIFRRQGVPLLLTERFLRIEP